MSLGMPGMSTHKPSVLNLVSTLRCVGACVGCNPVITLLQSLKSPVTFSACKIATFLRGISRLVNCNLS